MHKGLIRVPTTGMSREEWLQQRNTSIGGSDAATIIGLNPYSSPYAIWAEKTGRISPKDDNEAMRQGRDLESYVANRWCEVTGKNVRRRNAILKNPDYPFAHANIDRIVIGENAGLECKTTSSMNLQRFKNGDYPDNYYVQCVHYMAVTGADRWYLAVLVLGKELYTFTIERDENEIDALMSQEARFWDYVDLDEPPPVDGDPATTNALETIYSNQKEGVMDLFGRESLCLEYQEQLVRKKLAETRMEEIKQTLVSDLGEYETGVCGIYTVNWKSQSRRNFNKDALIAAHPLLSLDPYYSISNFRRFEIKETSR